MFIDKGTPFAANTTRVCVSFVLKLFNIKLQPQLISNSKCEISHARTENMINLYI